MKIATALLSLLAGSLGVFAQQQRPATIPIHTWVREDLFAGFMADDMARFERGEQKVLEYLAETPGRPDASAWLVGAKLYRASRAFKEGKTSQADALVREATQLMDTAVAKAPNDPGVQATTGGSIVVMANELPEKHYAPLMERARIHFARLYAMQSRAVPQLPLHIKGELLAGVAETEFRVGDRERARAVLNQIVTDMPGTPYAKSAAMWLAAPAKVTKDTKLVCQSCHEPGRLSSWMARQPKG